MKNSRIELAVIALASAVLLLAAWMQWAPIDFAEACGFVTGAVCVWLVTKGNIWNWPLGLLNNIVFAWLFWRARLFADMGLQAVYFILGVWGWWNWLYGGLDHHRLRITRTTTIEWVAVGVFLLAGTWGLHELLVAVNGAAPLADALTTNLCLSAQYLLCRKRLEHWFLWLAADFIYVPLYFHRHLPLTAVLYAGFIILCVLGLSRWRREFFVQRHGQT